MNEKVTFLSFTGTSGQSQEEGVRLTLGVKPGQPNKAHACHDLRGGTRISQLWVQFYLLLCSHSIMECWDRYFGRVNPALNHLRQTLCTVIVSVPATNFVAVRQENVTGLFRLRRCGVG